MRKTDLLADLTAKLGLARRSSEGGTGITPPQGALGEVLRSTMTAAVNRDAGLLVTLDELQNATPSELHEPGGVLQESVPKDWPLVVAVAALPTLRDKREQAPDLSRTLGAG